MHMLTDFVIQQRLCGFVGNTWEMLKTHHNCSIFHIIKINQCNLSLNFDAHVYHFGCKGRKKNGMKTTNVLLWINKIVRVLLDSVGSVSHNPTGKQKWDGKNEKKNMKITWNWGTRTLHIFRGKSWCRCLLNYCFITNLRKSGKCFA